MTWIELNEALAAARARIRQLEVLLHRTVNRAEAYIDALRQELVTTRQRIHELEEEMATHVTPTTPPAAPYDRHTSPNVKRAIEIGFVTAAIAIVLIVALHSHDNGKATATDTTDTARLEGVINTRIAALGTRLETKIDDSETVFKNRLDNVVRDARLNPPTVMPPEPASSGLSPEDEHDFVSQLVEKCGVTSGPYKAWKSGDFVHFHDLGDATDYVNRECPPASNARSADAASPRPIYNRATMGNCPVGQKWGGPKVGCFNPNYVGIR